MKNHSLIPMRALVFLGTMLTGAALAVPVPPPASPGDGSPSAPEPSLIILAAIGLVVVGGYLLWRHRRSQKASAK